MIRVGIIGIGAMGCLFGARLSRVADVVLLGTWPAQLAALRENGLTLIDPAGEETHHTFPILSDPAEAGPVDLALVLVKSTQTTRAAQWAARILAPAGPALTLQNGLGNRETVAAVLGDERALLGVTTQGATVTRPGMVRHAGAGPTHLAGAGAEILSLFRAAGFETHPAGDVRGLVWGKLAVNAGINPLTALLGVPNGFLADHDAARTLMARAATETAAVAHAQGIALPFPDAAQRALDVAQATAANHSSMLQDVRNGRPTEIDAICGAIVRSGRVHNVPTPVNATLLALLQAKIAEGGDWRLEIEALPADLQPPFSTLATIAWPGLAEFADQIRR